MSLPEGGFDSREKSPGRRILIWCAVAVTLVVGWAWLVLGWGGSAEDNPDKLTGGEVARTGGAGEDQKDSGASSVPEEAAYAGSEGGDSFSPDESMLESSREPGPGESPGSADDGAGAQGATNEPGVYDPLGTGASSSDLAPTEEARVRYATEKFVMAAYGYTGDDAAEYLEGVAATSLSPDLSLSAGGEEISRYAEQVEKSGTKSAAVLTDFEFQETSQGSVRGVASFETGEGYEEGGELTGERLAYKQAMTLSRMGAAWKVRATEKVEELEQTRTDKEER